MRLDIIIPTYNRSTLLARTLASVLSAEEPPELRVQVVVVDNGSRDDTAAVVRGHEEQFRGRLRYILEPRPGKSNALNAGIAASDADLIGMIDDDEEIDRGWLVEVQRAFTDPDLDFIGGPYLPRWGAEPPRWLPREFPAVIGWVENGDQILAIDETFPGTLMGGNAVIRRPLLQRVGAYRPELGPAGDKRLLSCEDEEMHGRLLAAGARGQFRPRLRIYHYVPPERLTREYYRRWMFWHGVSKGHLDRMRPQRVVYLAGVPRYMLGDAARGLGQMLRHSVARDRARRWFTEELRLRDFIGFLWGRFVYRAPPRDDRLTTG